MGFNEGTQKVLVVADRGDSRSVWCSYCADPGIGNRTFHLHLVLEMFVFADPEVIHPSWMAIWMIKRAF